MADYRLAVKAHPGDSLTIADLAETEMEELGDCAAANTDYSQAIALAKEPEVLDLENRAIVRLCLGDLANSYSDYQSAVAVALKETSIPFDSLYLDAWAVGVRLGRKDDADKALTEQLAAAMPDNDPTLPDLDRDIASVYLGKADISLIAKDATTYAAWQTGRQLDRIWSLLHRRQADGGWRQQGSARLIPADGRQQEPFGRDRDAGARLDQDSGRRRGEEEVSGAPLKGKVFLPIHRTES